MRTLVVSIWAFSVLPISLIHGAIDKEIPNPKRVLFIGNSLIGWKSNWATTALQEMIDGSGLRCRIETSLKGGSSLKYHWDSKNAETLIRENKYNIVVLQNFSRSLNREYTILFDSLIKSVGSKTMIYQTDSDPYSALLAKSYVEVANEIDAQINPVSEVMRAMGAKPRHSESEGRYLKALSFYYRFFGEFPSGGPFQENLERMKSVIRKELAPYISLEKLLERVAAPSTLTKDSIFFDSDFIVHVTSKTPGATIHYTTDETTPNQESPVYNHSISLNQTCYLTLIATKTGYRESKLVRKKFVKAWNKGAKISAKSVTSSPSKRSPELVADGNNKLSWYTSEMGGWIQFDLGTRTKISQLQVEWEQAKGRSYDIDVLVSNNGIDWDRANWETNLTAEDNGKPIYVTREGQYLRIANQKKSFLSLREVNIYEAGTETVRLRRIWGSMRETDLNQGSLSVIQKTLVHSVNTRNVIGRKAPQ